VLGGRQLLRDPVCQEEGAWLRLFEGPALAVRLLVCSCGSGVSVVFPVLHWRALLDLRERKWDYVCISFLRAALQLCSVHVARPSRGLFTWNGTQAPTTPHHEIKASP